MYWTEAHRSIEMVHLHIFTHQKDPKSLEKNWAPRPNVYIVLIIKLKTGFTRILKSVEIGCLCWTLQRVIGSHKFSQVL